MVRRPPPHMSSAAPTKTEPSRPSDGSFMAPIIGAIAIVAVGFVAATFYMEARASAIDRDTEQIEDNALPSVEHLAAARAALWRLEMSSREFANEGKGRAQAAADMEAERKRLNHELAAEFASDLYPGEGELQSSAMHLVSEVDLALSGSASSISEAQSTHTPSKRATFDAPSSKPTRPSSESSL
jgi:hypothetical protein